MQRWRSGRTRTTRNRVYPHKGNKGSNPFLCATHKKGYFRKKMSFFHAPLPCFWSSAGRICRKQGVFYVKIWVRLGYGAVGGGERPARRVCGRGYAACRLSERAASSCAAFAEAASASAACAKNGGGRAKKRGDDRRAAARIARKRRGRVRLREENRKKMRKKG